MLFASMDLWAQPTNSNPLSDIRVRHAIAYAIDMDTIRDTLLEGKAITADAHIPNGPYNFSYSNHGTPAIVASK